MQGLRVPARNRSIRRFQRFQAPVRARSNQCRGAGEMLGADAGFQQTVLQALQSVRQERAFGGLFAEVEADRGLGAVSKKRAPLPIGRQILGIAGFDEGEKKMLAERFRIAELELALGRSKPGGRDQAQHRFATVRRVFQSVLPALARTETLLGVDVEEEYRPSRCRSAIASALAASLASLLLWR